MKKIYFLLLAAVPSDEAPPTKATARAVEMAINLCSTSDNSSSLLPHLLTFKIN